ncbi:hypothetical protein ACIBCB_18210 [Streptomyces uncialis]|uniref:hypothetical protein n=1 Tax=Streptomyces uncialis TaxID=1048205 RepID=UPI0037B261E8
MTASARDIWTIEQIRADDLKYGDAALLGGRWREVREAFKWGDDPAEVFLEDDPVVKRTNDILERHHMAWVAAVVFDEQRSRSYEAEFEVIPLFWCDLVTVQRKVVRSTEECAHQAPSPPSPPGLTPPADPCIH